VALLCVKIKKQKWEPGGRRREQNPFAFVQKHKSAAAEQETAAVKEAVPSDEIATEHQTLAELEAVAYQISPVVNAG
jgi:hypothetical protein